MRFHWFMELLRQKLFLSCTCLPFFLYLCNAIMSIRLGAEAILKYLPKWFSWELSKHLLFIRKNVLEVWPQIDVVDRIESRCPLDTWASDLSIYYGSGQTPKDVDEEDCPRSLCSVVNRGCLAWLHVSFWFSPSLCELRNVKLYGEANRKTTR